MLIYFAGPFFCDGEKAFGAQLTEKLEGAGFEVFLPQRDGIDSSQPSYANMNIVELYPSIFTTDRDKILEADIFLFILDGRVPDEGGCVELGIAYGQKYLLKVEKLMVGLHTDMRGAFPDAKLNAMIQGSLDTVVDNEDALLKVLDEYRLSKQK